MIPKFITKKILELLTFKWEKVNKNFLIIFQFHQVTPKFNPKYHIPGMWGSLDYFEKKILYIKNNFKLVPLYEGLRLLENDELSGNCASVTFDDGDVSLERYAVPLLKKYNIPATFFINSAYIGQDKLPWYIIYNYLGNVGEKKRFINSIDIKKILHTNDKSLYNKSCKELDGLAYLIEEKNRFYVSEYFLKNLDKRLFTIGLHGHEHHRFSMLSRKHQLKDIKKNIEILSKFRTFKPIFAIPFGRPKDWDNELIKVCLDKKLYIINSKEDVNIQKNIIYSKIPMDNKDIKNFSNKSMLRL